MPDLKKVQLTLPARTEDLRKLEIGSVAYLTGRLFTAREGVYKRAIEDGTGMPAGQDALGTANFHCSPAACSAPTTFSIGAAAKPVQNPQPSPPPPASFPPWPFHLHASVWRFVPCVFDPAGNTIASPPILSPRSVF